MGIPGAFAVWTLLVFGACLTGHPFAFNADWLRKAVLPPCPPWDAPFPGGRPARPTGLPSG